MLSALLTGMNRAGPYANLDDNKFIIYFFLKNDYY
jgi:hypothetical protein